MLLHTSSCLELRVTPSLAGQLPWTFPINQAN
jgi:hypothetical protein